MASPVDESEHMFYDAAMNRPHYTEIPCKTALNRVSGMPFRWSLNPYRGCVHGCHYCYARATHAHLGLNADDDFTTRIIVKSNMPEVLRQELSRRSWTRERVALGTATDAYQPCEGRYRLTRRVLATLADFRTPVSVVTKSTLVLRDQDLLVALAAMPGTRVNFTITTLDPDLWRAIEPGTPPPGQRLAVMRRLADAGVPCGVYMAPVLPGLTDDDGSIAAVAEAAWQHGATSFWAGPLRLAPLVKEHYAGFLRDTFPALLPQYARLFPGANAPGAYRERLEERIATIRRACGFAGDETDSVRAKLPPHGGSAAAGGQLRLPLG